MVPVRAIDIVERGQLVREVVLDTETTGLSPEEGHRIVEIGCLELINHLPTGRKFHSYLNPDRDIPVEATAIHGLAHKDLLSQPRFAEQVELFLRFIGDDKLVIHNASFDLSFLNAELDRLSLSPIEPHRAVDTLVLARQKFPGSPASLDALCKRFSINNSMREKHGALLDADLLAQVYVELIGARQPTLGFATESPDSAGGGQIRRIPRVPRVPREHVPSEAEVTRHKALLAKLRKPIWLS